jgi:hypothetical protein
MAASWPATLANAAWISHAAGRSKAIAQNMRHCPIDFCHPYGYMDDTRSGRGVTGDSRLMERVRFPRAGLVTQLPGGPGIASAGMMTGLRGAPLDWDSASAGNTCRRKSQETRPGLSHGIDLRGKRRGGAPRGGRARSADEWRHSLAWRAPCQPARLPGVSVFRRSASLHLSQVRQKEWLPYA